MHLGAMAAGRQIHLILYSPCESVAMGGRPQFDTSVIFSPEGGRRTAGGGESVSVFFVLY